MNLEEFAFTSTERKSYTNVNEFTILTLCMSKYNRQRNLKLGKFDGK